MQMRRVSSVNKLNTLPKESFLRVTLFANQISLFSSKRQNLHQTTTDFWTNEVIDSLSIFQTSGLTLRIWKTRWFVLKGHRLFYTRNPKSQLDGVIHLLGCKVAKLEGNYIYQKY
jgi:hypothetical protein